MDAPDDFYVGYLPTLSPSFRRAVRAWIGGALAMMLLVALSVVLFQNELNDHQYHPVAELGTKSFCCKAHASSDGHERGIDGLLGGYLVASPVPMLRVPVEGGSTYDVLLVAAGKFGFSQTLERWAELNGMRAEGRWVCLRGNLIYGKGRALIEVEQAADIIACAAPALSALPSKFEMNATHSVDLIGEVIDPKCYIGVMKPGESTVHRSCAIRCISGGIPPVLRVVQNGTDTYYLLRGTQGQDIRQSVLPYVASMVRVSGRAQSATSWGVIYADTTSITRVLLN